MALIKNFGIAGIGQSVQYGKGGGKVVYDTSNSMFKITTNDGTYSSQRGSRNNTDQTSTMLLRKHMLIQLHRVLT